MAAAKRGRIVDRHQQAGFAGPDDFAASRHVGGDHWPAAGGGLEQAFRQALAPRRQHRDMRARPERRDVVDVAEPGDAGLAAPAGRPPASLDRRRIGRVGRSGEQQLDIRAALPQQPLCARSACGCPCRPRAGRRRPSSTGPAGSGIGCSVSMSTPEPGISTMRSAAMPSESMSARSSGFCTSTTCPSAVQQPSGAGRP